MRFAFAINKVDFALMSVMRSVVWHFLKIWNPNFAIERNCKFARWKQNEVVHPGSAGDWHKQGKGEGGVRWGSFWNSTARPLESAADNAEAVAQ